MFAKGFSIFSRFAILIPNNYRVVYIETKQQGRLNIHHLMYQSVIEIEILYLALVDL